MKVLILSPYPEKLEPILQASGDEYVVTQDKITPEYLRENKIDIGLSFGYRHIIKQDVIDVCDFVNMHISYLPWNKGADPNFWSWVENTPKGVSIHYIDAGMDTGDIIAQGEVPMSEAETLASSYDKLQEAIITLLGKTWPDIRKGTAPRWPQAGEGSLHYLADKEKLEHLLTDGYDTPVSKLIGKK